MIRLQTFMRALLCAGAFAATADLAEAQVLSGTLLVVVKGETALAVVDTASGRVLSRIPTGKVPHNVAASTDGKLAFTSNVGDDTLSVIDLTAQKELRRVELGPLARPHGVVYVEGKLYFTADGYKLIGCYDVASNKVEWLLGTGVKRGEMLVLSKDRKTIFTANNTANSVVAIQLGEKPTDSDLTVIPVGMGPQGIDMSPDGKEVWVVHENDGSVAIIDVATKKVVQTLTMQGTKRSNRLKFSPDGKRVLVTDTDFGLVVFDATTRKEVTRVALGTAMADIIVAPDGSRAFVASGEGTVAVIDMKTLQLTSRIPAGKTPEGMAWVAGK
jgi:YVTN family beta-propeller protein